uniref:ZP domain-containing protein n=1 Tax=Ciona savignyi TaxID=51511 RepID=H2Z402_CIOSA
MTDDACSAKLVNRTSEGKPPVYRIEIREPFHSCGTVARIIGNPSSRNRRIAFQNRLWWVQRKNNDVTMPFRLSDIECVFSNESFIEKAIKPICCDAVTLFNTSSGDVRVKMELWKDPPEPHAAQRSLSPPFLYELGQDLFVSIRLVGSENIRLQSCYLSSGFDGRSNRNLLIGNGCPVTNASRVLKTGNGSMTSFVFPVVMVQTSSFYVNCDITICINP